MRRFAHDERGAIAAEQVAAIVIVAALIAAVWSVALPQRVEDVAEVASDCLFQADPESCEIASDAEQDGPAQDDAADADADVAVGTVPQPARPGVAPVPPLTSDAVREAQRRAQDQLAQAAPGVAPGGAPVTDPVVDGAVERVDELLDGGWLRGVTAGDLEDAIEVLAGLSDDELDAAFDQLPAEQRQTLLDEVYGHNRLARWRNLSENQQARFANDVLARLSDEQLTRLDRRQLADEVLPHLTRDNRRAVFDAVDFEGVGRVVGEDAVGGDVRAGGDPATGNDDLDAYHDAAGEFWAYLYVTFGRDSLDGEGGEMVGVVNADNDISQGNAHWSTRDELTRYTAGSVVDSIVFHELAHGLVQEMTGGLETRDHNTGQRNIETQAVNEAIADMFAMNITGKGTYGDDYPDHILNGHPAIRSPEVPGDRNHPSHTSDYNSNAHSGHANSTIVSHAYHRIREALGQDVAEQTLYRALDSHLETDAGMEDFRGAMVQAAEDLYGADSDERDGIVQAFADVGLDGSWSP